MDDATCACKTKHLKFAALCFVDAISSSVALGSSATVPGTCQWIKCATTQWQLFVIMAVSNVKARRSLASNILQKQQIVVMNQARHKNVFTLKIVTKNNEH